MKEKKTKHDAEEIKNDRKNITFETSEVIFSRKKEPAELDCIFQTLFNKTNRGRT